MRFSRSDSFAADYRKLSEDEKVLFRKAMKAFAESADRVAATGNFVWPRSLRVKSVRGAKGVFEMTWSFSGPDGRLTWEWFTARDEAGEPRAAIRLRRIGGHSILKRP
jgi:hypothetical protein